MFKCIISILICGEFMFSQPVDLANRIELSGSVSFERKSYNNPPLQNPTSSYPVKSQTFSLIPLVGYYLTSNVEIVIEPHFTVSNEAVNYVTWITNTRYYEDNRKYTFTQPGVALGALFQIQLFDKIFPFAGLKCEWNWSKTDFTSFYGYVGTTQTVDGEWSSADFNFPSYNLGAKILISNNSAVTLQWRSEKLYWRDGLNSQDGTNSKYAIGLSIFI